MVPRVELAQGAVKTTSIAFGCAGLYREPDAKARRRILDLAFDLGICHFDVAPMYGLGVAEGELSAFIEKRRDKIVVATKFGIDVTPLAGVISRHQAPIRRLLATAPELHERARAAAPDPSTPVGRVLYRRIGYSPAATRRSVERSLRNLRTEYIDILLLHDPPSGSPQPPELEDCLDDLVSSGMIRAWGISGDSGSVSYLLGNWPAASPVVQVGHSLVLPVPESLVSAPGGCVVFGSIGGVVAAIQEMFYRRPEQRAVWKQRLGHDFDRVPGLLLAEAVRHNKDGVVVISSIRPSHVEEAVQCSVFRPDRDAIANLTELIGRDLLGGGAPGLAL